jgi:hypothetical protein
MNVVVFLLGDSLSSEFYVPTFRNNVCSIFVGGVKFRPRWITQKKDYDKIFPFQRPLSVLVWCVSHIFQGRIFL